VRIFVAGATGAIGRPLVRRLVAAGHDVVGMTRSTEHAEALRAAGAEPVVANAFDREGLVRALRDAHPEVVVNELTDIPRVIDPRHYAEAMAGLERIRTEGYANVALAAQAAGARRLVAESIAFLYRPAPGLASEDDPAWTDAPGPFASTVHATLAGERSVLEIPGVEGLVLRYGWFYGPGTSFAPDGSQTEAVRRRRLPLVGRGGGGIWSFIHVADAADATVLAVTSDATGILNVVDDDPAFARDWIPDLANTIGAPPPLRVPRFVVRLAAGRLAADATRLQRGASSARAKAGLGWLPAHPTWRGVLGT
jgi:nucleoside-diphosphate-sugar epimerase